MITTEFLCKVEVTLEPARELGDTPWFETSAARYAWLNRTVCVASGARRAAAVELDFFEVK